MTKKISIRLCKHLPMPLIYLPSIEDLARWQTDQLEWAYAQGHRDLAISFFDPAAMGFDAAAAASAVLHAVIAFLYSHPDVAHLTIRCGNTDPQPLIDMLTQQEKAINDDAPSISL